MAHAPSDDGHAELERQLTDFWRQTRSAHRELRGIVARNQKDIETKWKSKQKQKNKARKILRIAWPGIPLTHRADMDVDQLVSTIDQGQRRHVFLWPHLTEEDLLERPDTLLRLIHCRGTGSLLEYIRVDLASTRGGWKYPQVKQPLTNALFGYRIAFHEWYEGDAEASGLTVRSKQSYRISPTGALDGSYFESFNFAEALLIAEVQAHIYSFLVKVCKELLLPKTEGLTDQDYAADFDVECINSKPWPGQLPAAPDSMEETPVDGVIVPLSEKRRYAWYGKPEEPDLQIVGGLIRAKEADAKELILDMRAYPDVFEESVKHWKSVYDQTRLDEKSEDEWRAKSEKVGWQYAVRSAVSEPINAYARWSALQRYHTSLQTIRDNDKNLEAVETKREYQQLMVKFWIEVSSHAEAIIMELSTQLFCQRPFYTVFDFENFKPHFEKDPRRDQLPLRSRVLQSEVDAGSTRGRVLDKMRLLFVNNHRTQFGLSAVVDELDRVLDDRLGTISRDAPDVTPPHVASVLETLGILAECLNQIERLMSWSSLITDSPEEAKKYHLVAEKESDELRRPLHYLVHERDNIFHNSGIDELAIPYPERFDCPRTKERTKKVVQTLRSSEENLDKFWEKCIAQLKLHKALPDGVRLLLEIRPERTPVWSRPERPSRPPGPEPEPEPAQAEEAEVSIAGPSLHDEYVAKQRELEAADSPEPSTQLGSTTAQEASVQEMTSPPAVADVSQQGKIRVKASTLETLRIMMYDAEGPGSVSGELAWVDLRAAMIDIGFGMVKGTVGSAWNFIPGRSLQLAPAAADTAITFHDPHPRRRMDANLARMCGRRLNRRYGWTLDTFALK